MHNLILVAQREPEAIRVRLDSKSVRVRRSTACCNWFFNQKPERQTSEPSESPRNRRYVMLRET